MDNKKKQELGKVFEGRYTDPNHPGGFREITMLDEWKDDVRLAKVEGGKGKGEPEHFTLKARAGKRGLTDYIIIDFSPKGGPKDFEGVWEGNGIRFPKDNNKWPQTEAKNKTESAVLDEEELTEEDQALKNKIDALVEQLDSRELPKRVKAVNDIKNEIQGATSTMTSVPKPLKFLSPNYQKMRETFEKQTDAELKTMFADLLSVIAMVSSEQEDSNESLLYCLQGSKKNLVGWGHEYLRFLAGRIGNEFESRIEKNEPRDDINQLVDQIIPEFIDHNEEPEAVDLLLEVERLESLIQFTTENNFERVCMYLTTCAMYGADTDEQLLSLKTSHDIYKKFKRYPDALRLAQKMNNMDLINSIMNECKDKVTLKQLSFMLGRQRNPYESEDAELQGIISNEKLSEHFKSLARDLDVVEPKHPDSIFKSHLDQNSRFGGDAIDSAKKNLALTYVNAFVNAAYGKDLLITNSENNEDWVFKTKEDGQTAAAASLGMLLLWDIDEGFAQIDKYLDRSENDIVMGGFMALGLVNTGIVNEQEAVQALLIDKLESVQDQNLKMGALMGLSFTYAGSAKAELLEAISPIILDSSNTTQLQAVASLAIGLIYAGTCDEDAAQSVLQTLMEKEEDDLDNSFMRLFALGLGLLFLGQQSSAEPSMEVCKLIPNEKTAAFCELVVETCAYAGSGNVLKVQKMLHLCAEHKEDEKESIHQVAAVLGVALIAFGEEIGQEMCLRTMNHLLQYGEPIIRRTVPLAIGLLRISNPEVATLDLLNKLAYDSDAETSMTAIFALGLIGAGTNNSKLAGNLRYLASYYSGNTTQDQLFVVRIAQGLVHMGKGLLGLNPFHSDKFLFSNVSLAGLLTTLFCCTDMKTFIVGKYHYFLFYLTLSIYPRMLITLNENLEPVQTQVRVGNAVDTVGAAGKPKKITGFQTHDTPVLIGQQERAELASEEYLSETQVMENFVILRKNPDYEPPEIDKKKKK